MVLQSGDQIFLNCVKQLLLFIQLLDAFFGLACRYFDNVANEFAVGHRAHDFAVQFVQGRTDFVFVRAGMNHH